MDDAHKELVKRLRVHFRSVNASGLPCMTPRNPDGEEAALALEAMAGERDAWEKAAREHMDWRERNRERANAAESERDRLKAVLKPRLNAKAIEGLQEILEAMEAMDEREAPFLKTLLDWHEAARKALGDAS